MTQKVNTSNLAFIIQTSAFKIAALNNRAEFVRMLVSVGESAFALRQWDRLEQIGETLTGLSLPPPYQAVGFYYRGLAANPLGLGDQEEALSAYEYAVVNAAPVFQARTLLNLGAQAAYVGDRSAEAEFYREAIARAACVDCQDIYTVVHAHKMMAVLQSLEGDHRRALSELESLWPMVRAIARQDSLTYFDWLNSLAVELGELGQVERAQNVARIVTASPLATAYPEWQETADDLAAMQSQAIIIQVPAVAPLTVSKVSTTPGPSLLIYWLWSLARPVCLAPSASARNTSPNPSNSILARYVTQARIRAPDFLLM